MEILQPGHLPVTGALVSLLEEILSGWQVSGSNETRYFSLSR